MLAFKRSGFRFLCVGLATLNACQIASKDDKKTVIELKEKKKSTDLSKPGSPPLGEQEDLVGELWPANLRDQSMLCENTRSSGARASTLLGLTLAANSKAGAQVLFFKDSISGSVPTNLRSPFMLSTDEAPYAQKLFFEGRLQYSNSGGLMNRVDVLFSADMNMQTRNIPNVAHQWAPLPERRLSQSSLAAALPSWLKVSDSAVLIDSETNELAMMPRFNSGESFALYSKDLETQTNLWVNLENAFLVNSFQDPRYVSFQISYGSSLQLRLYDFIKKEFVKLNDSKLRYFLASDEESFWFWSWNSSRAEWSLVKKSGTLASAPTKVLWKTKTPVLAKYLRASTDEENPRWLLAMDDQAQVEFRDSESFEILALLPYPANAQKLVSVEELPQSLGIYALEFEFSRFQNRVYLLNLSQNKLRGPVGRAYCSSSTLR